MNKIKRAILKALCLYDYGTKCHGYAPDGGYAHYYRCHDADCPNRIKDNEFYEDGEWKIAN